MFTGLIEETGLVKAIKPLGGGKRLSIAARVVMDGLKIDDSIALDGVCQTVVRVNETSFDVEAVEETLAKTTINSLSVGSTINLERAARLGGRMGGHLVQGHVDTTGSVVSIVKQQTGILVTVEYPSEFDRYIIPVGSIAINGVSLTVARVRTYKFTVSIIPHTWKVTTLGNLNPGNKVNLEFDLIGKYVEKMLSVKEKKASILDQYYDQPF